MFLPISEFQTKRMSTGKAVITDLPDILTGDTDETEWKTRFLHRLAKLREWFWKHNRRALAWLVKRIEIIVFN